MEPEHGAPTVLGAAVANYGGAVEGRHGRAACGEGGPHVPCRRRTGVMAWSALPRGCGHHFQTWQRTRPRQQQGRLSADTHGAGLQSLRSPELWGRSAAS